MKKILISLLLPLSITAMAQVVEVNVSALSEEGSNERVGVVLKKDADTEAFYNLMVELKNHSDKVVQPRIKPTARRVKPKQVR